MLISDTQKILGSHRVEYYYDYEKESKKCITNETVFFGHMSNKSPASHEAPPCSWADLLPGGASDQPLVDRSAADCLGCPHWYAVLPPHPPAPVSGRHTDWRWIVWAPCLEMGGAVWIWVWKQSPPHQFACRSVSYVSVILRQFHKRWLVWWWYVTWGCQEVNAKTAEFWDVTSCSLQRATSILEEHTSFIFLNFIIWWYSYSSFLSFKKKNDWTNSAEHSSSREANGSLLSFKRNFFESWPDHQLSWLMIFVVFLSPSSQLPE